MSSKFLVLIEYDSAPPPEYYKETYHQWEYVKANNAAAAVKKFLKSIGYRIEQDKLYRDTLKISVVENKSILSCTTSELNLLKDEAVKYYHKKETREDFERSFVKYKEKIKKLNRLKKEANNDYRVQTR